MLYRARQILVISLPAAHYRSQITGLQQGCVKEAADPSKASLEQSSRRTGGTPLKHNKQKPLKHPTCCSRAHAAHGRRYFPLREEQIRGGGDDKIAGSQRALASTPTRESSQPSAPMWRPTTCSRALTHARLAALLMHTHARAGTTAARARNPPQHHAANISEGRVGHAPHHP